MARKVSIDDLEPQQARMIAEAAEIRADQARVVGHRDDAQEWDEVARKAHAAADRGVAA